MSTALNQYVAIVLTRHLENDLGQRRRPVASRRRRGRPSRRTSRR
jgi:hypothetical protein